MLFVAHRINTIKELQQIPTNFGVEIDLRDSSERLILQHDPFSNGELFEDWLAYYKHAFLILNIKSEGIEWKVLELLKLHNITQYMFLDCSVPMIMKLIKAGESNIAIRYSEVEPIDLAARFINKVKWLWVDCFTQFPPFEAEMMNVMSHFQLCLVSPSLQNRAINEDDKQFCSSIQFHAVCEKIYNAKQWLKETF